MTSSATTRNRLEKQGTGDNSNTWGTYLNGSIDLIDAALDGRTAFTLSGSKTLSSANYSPDESRERFLDITGGTGGTVTIPAVEKWYIVRNASSGDVVFTTGSGATVTVKPGSLGLLVCDGTNIRAGVDQYYVNNQIAQAALSTVLPMQPGNGGKYLKTDGSNATWEPVNISDVATLSSTLAAKQNTLVSGTNIKTINGSTLLGSGDLPVVTSNVQEFSSSGTWTKPTGAQFVMVEVWGAGGGGASGTRDAAGTDRNGGAGGGGGSYNYRLFKASDLASSVSITVGAGGTGGAAVTTNSTAGNSGTNGGTSSFGTLVYAYGGGFGTASFAGAGAGTFSSANGTTAGQPFLNGYGQFGGGGESGGFPAGGYASNFGGGSGGKGQFASGFSYRSPGGSSTYGGAGGGGASALSAANAQAAAEAGGSTVFGVAGGAAATTTGAAGTAGAFRCGGGGGFAGDTSGTVAGGAGGNGGLGAGGGGGGASTNGANSGKGGDGGNGFVRVYSW